ncbi:unnamed protein product [Meloidogyne enterolobii]|uniref:Uncharacterized protein n=1 Tax=Meloidogyne enterolobii TaxID=390850 RepID=A0ACB0YYY6_MELEN
MISDSTIKLNNEIFKCVNFVEIKNKWSEIDSEYKCCNNKCINTNKPIGNCIIGNGFVNIIDDENINYINCLEWGHNKYVVVLAENSFKKQQNCFNYSLYYFEIKCKFEVDLNDYKWMSIGLNNCTNNYIEFSASFATVHNEKNEGFELGNISWNNNDIFGCGLVYPPTNVTDAFPYVFFTHNGKQIGKACLLKERNISYKPFVELKICSIEANFGDDLETKPFTYDISKHFILKEFY